MNTQSITHSQLGDIFAQHLDSLPRWKSQRGRYMEWPWVLCFLVGPAGGAAALSVTGLAPSGPATAGLLAGVGVLGGFLFQVLASVAGRIADLADGIGARPPTRSEISLVRRLDIARANIAYASLVSLVFVVLLGLIALAEAAHPVLIALSAFLLLHLGSTLVLVVIRINQIGQDDRVKTLTSHAHQD